jgi:hypothetical protein
MMLVLDDAGALADRLARLCTDSALNILIGRGGRETIERRYAEVVAAEIVLDMWDRMLLKSNEPAAITSCSPSVRSTVP